MGADLILELLPLLISGITNGIAAIHKIEEAWSATTERTPEQEAAFDKYLAALKASPYWQQQD
jgi:hypothetical protein